MFLIEDVAKLLPTNETTPSRLKGHDYIVDNIPCPSILIACYALAAAAHSTSSISLIPVLAATLSDGFSPLLISLRHGPEDLKLLVRSRSFTLGQ